MHLLDLVFYKPLNISIVPFNTTKPTPNGHNVGGYRAKNEIHPHQISY